jgi:hypothetical protein
MSLENKKPIKYTVAKKMKYHLQSAVEHCTFWQLTTKGEHQYNQLSEEEFHEAAGA